MFIENTKELAQNKLLLLYLVYTSDEVLCNKKITEFLLEKDYMNYFLVQQYLSELVATNLINIEESSNDKTYHITEKGKVTLLSFENRIPESFKLDVKDNFTKSDEAKKRDKEVLSEFYQKENGQYVVNLKLVENNNTIFSIYVDVPDSEQAEIISKFWKENTDSIYLNILNALTNDSLK